MRTLKFRFWKKGVLQGYRELNVTDQIIDMPWKWDRVDQFTGLLDRHGKEIYEGDRLECTSELITWGTGKPTGKMQTTRVEVVYVSDHACFAKRRPNGYVEKGLGMNQEHIGKYYEVIGNIYKAPDEL